MKSTLLHQAMKRRHFLWQSAWLAAGAPLLKLAGTADRASDLIAGIERVTLWNGRKAGKTWFHPRACALPSKGSKVAVYMTLQEISGSDLFGTVHWTRSLDLGTTWSEPEPIRAFERKSIAGALEEGVCDVVPQFHAATGSILAMGHNVYYQGNKLTKPAEDRFPVYAVGSPEGQWSERKRLVWDDPRGSAIYTSNCGQRVHLENGEVLVPLSFGPKGRTHRSVSSLLCSFDGRELKVKRTGNELVNPVKRGLLEPSLVRWGGTFFMTIRAEDDRGYVTRSPDGLSWAKAQAWSFEDGEPLTMSTTQQHWVAHRERLFLVYTRRTEENQKVMRWRAPLYIAAVDVERLCLIRASEQVLLPLVGDPAKDPNGVARMGNFHPVSVTPSESWVTVGEEHPANNWKGDTLLARLRWSRENETSKP